MKNYIILIVCTVFINCTINGQTSEEYFQLSTREFEKKNIKRADSLITLAINKDKNKDYLKYYNRGIYRKSIDSISLAIKDFSMSLLINPNFYPALENRAICNYYIGNDSIADIDMDRAIEIDSENIEGYVLNSIINLKLKNYEKIINLCSKGLEIKSDPRLYSYRIIAYVKKGNFQLAERDINLAEKLFGSSNRSIMQAKIVCYFYMSNSDLCNLYKKFKELNYNMSLSGFQDVENELKKCK